MEANSKNQNESFISCLLQKKLNNTATNTAERWRANRRKWHAHRLIPWGVQFLDDRSLTRERPFDTKSA